jgi:hypothetical protein
MGLTPVQWNTLASGQTLLFSTRQQPGAAPLPPALAAEILRNQGQSQGEVQAVHVRLWVSYSNSEARLNHMQRVTRTGSAGEGGGSLANSLSQPPRAREAGPDQLAAWQRDPLLGARRPFGVDPVKAAPVRRFTPGQPSILHVYEILPALAEAYGINLVADAYRTQRFGRQPAAMPQELALYEALNRHLEHVGEWTRDGEFIRARSRTWYHDRLAEIPARVIRHWNTRLRRERQMTLDDAAAVTLSLRNEQLAQFEGALADEGVHLHATGFGRGAAFHEGSNRELLRAYGTLQPRQQELLRSGGQVALADMPPDSRGWLLAAAEERRRQFATVELPPGELPPGLLSLSSVTVRREVTSVEEGQVRSILRALDGPEQGKEISSNSMGGSISPALTEGGQVFRQLAWRYQFSETWSLTSNLTLPWVYIDPSVKQQAEKTTPAAP